MTATQRFIEDAIKGGWRAIDFDSREDRKQNYINGVEGRLEQILLDPLAWRAVGKTRGWNGFTFAGKWHEDEMLYKNEWHKFIDHLADGRTIEEALKSLETN